ncbi:MAG: hypothetical protein H0X17_06850 [Deltaproteobacteria bacterium]|nr:hypothetical protein [Deltaproteobacteria bacterium]
MIVVVACARLWRMRADPAIRRSSDSYVAAVSRATGLAISTVRKGRDNVTTVARASWRRIERNSVFRPADEVDLLRVEEGIVVIVVSTTE